MNRRQTLIGLSSLATSCLITSPLLSKSQRLKTPRQTAGPFYPVNWQGDIDNDLVIVKGEEAKALGIVLHLEGNVMDKNAKPVPGAEIEIWQCDASGIYHHPYDTGPTRKPDIKFQGRGRTTTDRNGKYKFRTIKPVAYTGRTPHIHFKISAPNYGDLITQMYIQGESLNKRDFLFNNLSTQAERNSLLVKLTTADRIELGAVRGVFDIIL